MRGYIPPLNFFRGNKKGFRGKPVFLHTSPSTRPRAPAPREGNTTSSHRAGAVRGDRHCPLRHPVVSNCKKLVAPPEPDNKTEWTRRDLNPRPLRCERSDLPLIYEPENCGITILPRMEYSCCCGKATAGKIKKSEDDLDVEFLCQFLVPVPDRDFRDPCHFRYFALGAPLSAQDRGDVDSGCCDPGRAPAAR